MLSKRASRKHPSTTPAPTPSQPSLSYRDASLALDDSTTSGSQSLTQASQVSTGPRGKQRGATNWHKDAHSPDDPSSYDLLVAWLIRGTNFAEFKWYSGDLTAEQKSEECATWLEANGCPTRRTAKACTKKINSTYAAWKNARDWLDGTGTGQGQRKLNDATAENREAVTLEVEAELELMCPHFRDIDGVLGDKDGGNRALRADSTTGVNPGHDTLVRSLSGSRVLESQAEEDSDLETADAETIYNLSQAAASFVPLTPTPRQSGPTTPSLHTVSQRSASGTASSSGSGRRSNPGAVLVDEHTASFLEAQKAYRKRKLEIEEESLKVSKRNARGDKYSRVWEAADRLMQRFPAMGADVAFKAALDSWNSMGDEEEAGGDDGDARNDDI